MDITHSLVNSNTITSTNPPKRVRLESDDWIDKAPRSRLSERWKEQDLYIDYLESCFNQLQQSIESNERLREKEAECRKLKSMLNYRFLTKTTQQQSLKQMRDMMQTPSLSRLRQTYLDPSINIIFSQMRDEIDQNRKAHEVTQNALQAFQFTSDGKIGKMLMARCKKLLEENEQLGKMISSDNVAKLEGEIALQNRLLSNMTDSPQDYEEILLDIDANMDVMSNTLLHIRNQLTDSHRQINLLNEENTRLKTLYESNNSNISTTINSNDSTPNGTSHTDRSDLTIKNKRLYSSNRTTPNIDITKKLKSTNNLYDLDELTGISSLNMIIVDDCIPLNSTNNDDSQRPSSISLENGIHILS